MLVLEMDKDEVISIDGKLMITLHKVKGRRVKLAFEGPKEMSIQRLSRIRKFERLKNEPAD